MEDQRHRDPSPPQITTRRSLLSRAITTDTRVRALHTAPQQNHDKLLPTTRASSRCTTHERQAAITHKLIDSKHKGQSGAQHLSGKPLHNTIATIQCTTPERQASTQHTRGNPMQTAQHKSGKPLHSTISRSRYTTQYLLNTRCTSTIDINTYTDTYTSAITNISTHTDNYIDTRSNTYRV